MDHPMWEITERPCEDEWEQESGQLLIDKQRGWRALLISLFFQRDHDFYFKIILGDKDTFRFGWKLAGTAYHMIKQPVAIGGRVRQGRFCGHSMIQFDPSGEALFVHTTALKTTNAVKSGQTWEAIQYFDATAPRKVKASEDGQLAYAGGYPVVNEYAGGQHKSKEEGGVGQETLPNPCLDLAIHNVTTHTFPSVVDGLGLQGAIDSYRVVLEDFSTYKGGKYADFESMYYKFGGPDSGDAEYCGNGFKGNSKCRDPNDCCSAWGYCGQTVDHCGVGCSGGNCFNKRPRPTKTPSKDFVYCGNGVLGSGFCPKEKDCCSRFGWCGNDRDMCSKANCVSGPCLS